MEDEVKKIPLSMTDAFAYANNRYLEAEPGSVAREAWRITRDLYSAALNETQH